MATATEPVVYHGMRTPWGKADHACLIIPGMGRVDTPSHGGIKLSAELNRRIPEIWRSKSDGGGWYEEDCASNIPIYFFRQEIAQSQEIEAVRLTKTLETYDPLVTLKGYWWREYEQHFDVCLAPGESMSKDEDLFKTVQDCRAGLADDPRVRRPASLRLRFGDAQAVVLFLHLCA